jgi:undecaprenyl pyrophosphate phosphatase UppP
LFITGLASTTHVHLLPWVWLYIGPDVFLPLTSALAAIAGVALMFWHRIIGLVKKVWLMVSRRKH